jgi:tripartite-type tricarboxylate transporter receptor subunit TctC
MKRSELYKSVRSWEEPRRGRWNSYLSTPTSSPSPQGGGERLCRRSFLASLQQELSQTIIVENRAGAGTNIGTSEVARAEPDGLTLLLTSSAFVVNPALYKSIPYDPSKDFAPIAALPVAPNVIAVNAKGDIKSLSEVVARAKAIRRSSITPARATARRRS